MLITLLERENKPKERVGKVEVFAG